MATCDHPSGLVRGIAYPTLQRPGLRLDLRVAALPAEGEKHPIVPSSQQGMEGDSLFREIESGARLGRNPFAGAGALALQGLLLLALVVIPLFHTDPLPKRETLTMLYLQPPPAAGASPGRLEAPRPTSSYTPTSAAILTPLRKTEEAPPPAVSTIGAVAGGVPGGMIGGIPGGVITEMPSSAPIVPVLAKSPEPMPSMRIRVASRVVQANLIHDVPPQYPAEAGRARIEGTVVLLAVIGRDGMVQDLRVESGLPILAQAAIDAVKQWRYKPYMIDGEPVEVASRITINFTLSTS